MGRWRVVNGYYSPKEMQLKFPDFYGDPGTGSVTSGHVHQGK